MRKKIVLTAVSKGFIALSFAVALTFFPGCGGSGPDDAAPAERPSAKIICGLSALVSETVQLKGSGSTGRAPLSYSWKIISSPPGSAASLSGTGSENPVLVPDLPGIYTAALTVTDREGAASTYKHTLLVFEESSASVHVNINSPGPGDGSEGDPYTSIQTAVNVASPNSTIKIAEGTYTGDIIISDNKGLILLGGFASGDFSIRDRALHPVILAGTGSAAVITMEYSGGEGDLQLLEIDGFTIQGGLRGISAEDLGSGGVCLLRISDNTIQNNSGLTDAGDYGGGLWVRGMAAEIKNNIIRDNRCGKAGGLSLQLNTPDYTFIIEENLIENNEILSDHGAGAGIQAVKGILRNNIFRNNTILEAWGWGGGLIIDGNRYTQFTDEIYIELQGNTYSGNEVPSSGAGLFIDEGANVRMKNELIFGNRSGSSSRGGALYVDGPRGTGRAVTLAELCTVADNTAPDGSLGQGLLVEGGSSVSVKNSIFSGNRTLSGTESDFFIDAGSTLTVSYSIADIVSAGSGSFKAVNSFKDDPLFGDPLSGNYYLKSDSGRWDPVTKEWVTDSVRSPAIDRGDPSSSFADEPLPNGGRVNIGAWGNTPFSSMSN